ncbi:MAG: STAS domain-containing protein [SAR324 cluster bacterium]|nr:STAS domain-containing protein [SAR324 cluster bacterium]
MEIKYRSEHGACIIAMDANFMSIKNEIIIKKINELRKSKDIQMILIDMEQVPFLNSSQLGRLMGLIKVFKDYGVLMSICSLNEFNSKVFAMTNFDKRFALFPSIEEALKNLQE